VLVLQVVWDIVLAAQSQFFADDFLWFRVVREQGLSIALLKRSAFGHFVPAVHLTNWLFPRFVGADRWWLAVAFLVAWHLAITWGVYRFGTVVGASPRVRLVMCAVAAFTPIFATGIVWWEAGLCLLTSTALNVWTFVHFVSWSQGNRRSLLWMLLTFTGACLFWEKSVMTAAWIGLFSFLVMDAGAPIRERVRRAVSRWPAWVTFAIPGSVIAVLYVSGGYSKESSQHAATLRQLVEFVRGMWFEGWWPLLAGFHAKLAGTFEASSIAMIVGQLVLLALVVAVVLRRRIGWIDAALWFLVVFLLNMTIVGFARAGELGKVSAIDPRYHYDNIYMFSLVVLYAAGRLPRRRQSNEASRRVQERKWVAAGSIGLVWLVVALSSGWNIAVDSNGHVAKSYIANLERSLDHLPPHSRFIDGVVPVDVVIPQFFPYNTYSRALTQLGDISFTTDPQGAYFVDADGTARRVQLAPVSEPLSTQRCIGGSGQGAGWLEAPLSSPLPQGNWAVEVAFADPVPTDAAIAVRSAPGASIDEIKGTGSPIHVEPGATSLLAVMRYTSVASVLVFVPAGVRRCVDSIRVGTLTRAS
jgi:hypothetical protein